MEHGSQGVSGPSSADIVVPVARCTSKLWHSLVALQVSHQGYKYSIERLLALDEYTRTTPLWRVLLVCFGSPFPMILMVFLNEMVPLDKPDNGWRANYGFFIRTAILGAAVALSVVLQMKYLFGGFPLPYWQMWQIAVCSALGIVTTPVLLAEFWTFPIPFMTIVVSAPTIMVLVGSFRIIVGRQIFAEILARREQLPRLMVYFSSLISLCFIYPAYQLLFNAVAGTRFHLLMIISIPVIRIMVQNVIARTMTHFEDMIPESVIFAADFFNATYLVTFMQTSSSTNAMTWIVAVDYVQIALTLVSLQRRTSSIFSQLQHITAEASTNENLLSQVSLLCRNPRTIMKQAGESFRRRSCISHQVSHADAILLANLGPNDAILKFKFPHTTNAVVPIGATSPTRGEIGRCAPKRRVQTIEKTLKLFFTSEFVILTEYLEAVIPIFYGVFVLVMVHLPSARYHSELAGITHQNVGGVTQRIFYYALLEVASFVLLAVAMKRSCNMSVLHHLAFVLETQMSLVQIKMITWMLMIMSFRVAHFGADFTFRFAWVAHKT